MNQRYLLDHYITQNEELRQCRILEFLDDGRTGTNFERPGFQSMMEQIKCGEVNIIIVKDFSRFGRNYIEVGNFLEFTFPFLGIRFISVNDDYDTKNQRYGTAGDINIGIHNLINEIYSREISEKVKTAQRQYAKRGQYINAYPFFGYIKSKEDRRTLVPDPPAAAVVRKVFDLCLAGKSNAEIAKELYAEGAPTPSLRKRQLGAKRTTWNSARKINEWSAKNVLLVLREERYTGKFIGCRETRQELGKASSSKDIPKSQWIIVPNAFEAIISQVDFDAVQEKIHIEEKGYTVIPEPRVFHRKLKCGCCSLAPELMKAKRRYYKCEMKAWNSDQGCEHVRIYEDDLIQTVLASIRHQAQLADRVEKQLQVNKRQRDKANQSISEQIGRLQEKIKKLSSKRKQVFLWFIQGGISQQGYEEECSRLNLEIAALLGKITSLEKSAQSVEYTSYQEQISTLKQFTNLRTLNYDTVNKLIHCIWIYDASRIEIEWNFTAPYQTLIAACMVGSQLHTGKSRLPNDDQYMEGGRK
ncbi:MAG: recombinase family protein [Oscillospiraceae bacterium]|nr:recombinase family protein [Oscillospiraceae bacterium]